MIHRNWLNFILTQEKPSKLLNESKDFLFSFIPEFSHMVGFEQNNPHHDKDVWEHTITVIDNTPNEDLTLRLVALFHDCGKPFVYTEEDGIGHFYGHAKVSAKMCETIMQRLDYSEQLIEQVVMLVRKHDLELIGIEPESVQRQVRRIGKDTFLKLVDFKKADIMGQSSSGIEQEYRLLQLNQSRQNIEKMIEEAEKIALQFKDLNSDNNILAINGYDLLDLGIPEGPGVREMLNLLYEEVRIGNVENKKEALIEKAKKLNEFEVYF